MNAEIYAVGNEVIGAIAGGIVQGLAVFALVWIVLKLFRRATAATRHAVWLTTLLIVAALPFANLSPLLRLNAPTISEQDISESEFAGPLPEPVSAALAEPAPENTSKRRWEVSAPAQLGIALLAVWAVLALIRFAGLGRQLLLLRRIKTEAMPAAPLLAGAFSETAADLRVKRGAQLLISRQIAAPMAVGFFKPAVLLPHAVATESTDAQMGYVLRHELAHLARGDDWANLVQQFVTALFFFHPGILFLSRRLTREREIACDDHALAALKAPRDYALFLTEFASRMKGRDFTAAPAAWSSNSQLKERIGMILDKKRNASPRTSRAGVSAMAAATFLLAAAAFVGAPRLVLATEKPEAPTAPAAPTATPAIPAPPEISVEPAVAVDPSDIKVAISTEPALASIVHVHPTPAPHPKPAPAPKIFAHADLPDGPPRPRGQRDGDLERRLERVERMLESMAGRDKDKEKEKEKLRAGATTFEFHGMPKEDWNRMQREVERATRDASRQAERAMKDVEIEKIKRHALETTHGAEEQDHRLAARQALKAQRQALESQRRSLEKQIHELERQIQREDQAVERARESMERQKQRIEEEKERADEEKERAKERAKRDKEKEKEKRRDNESNSSASSISNSSNAGNNSNSDSDEKIKK